LKEKFFMTINTKQISLIATWAKKVVDKKTLDSIAADNLEKIGDINRSTALMYIHAYIAMSKGIVFKRTISEAAVRHYLEIFKKSNNLDNALKSLSGHLAYFKKISNSNPVGKTKVLEEYKKSVSPQDYFISTNEQIDLEMEKTIDELEKNLRLQPRKKPELITVTTQVYKRNPLLVAWALKKANGKCAACKKPAPFSKKSNNTPYLEVHHKNPLSNGGFDDMKNVIALCPNCHRKKHHG
jgi:5-methylcytosine-specific restriction protein A